MYIRTIREWKFNNSQAWIILFLQRIFQNSVGYVEDQNSRKVLDYGVELIRVDGDVARKVSRAILFFQPTNPNPHITR